MDHNSCRESDITVPKSGTRIAVDVDKGALELGVDALCVDATVAENDSELWEAMIEARHERQDSSDNNNVDGNRSKDTMESEPVIVQGTCKRITSSNGKSTVLADRVCIDLVQSLKSTEGCWLGSSAKIMALILSEAAQSSFVPSRPFRVNAGPVHSYVVMGDGCSTKYLSELQAGDEVLVTDVVSGENRPVAVGRLKVEIRPCVQVGLIPPQKEGDATNNEQEVRGQVFLQQAETVCLGQQMGDDSFIRVTDLGSKNVEANNVVLRIVGMGTHVGRAYSGKVQEK